MNWFLVKIVYRIICGDGRHTAQFDEQVRLITAPSRDKAWEKSRQIGRQEEETFFNDKQQLVQWKFVTVTDIYDLQELMDGAEVYSQIRETDDAESYCRFLHHKTQTLTSSFHSPLTPQTI